MENNILIFTYPFLEGGKEIFDPPTTEDIHSFDEYYTTLFTTHFNTHVNLYFKIVKLFDTALSKKEIGFDIKNDDSNVILYYTVKTVLLAIENPYIENHIANTIAKSYEKYLNNRRHNEVVEVCNRYGIGINFNPSTKLYSMYYIDYIKLIYGIRDKKFALVNQSVNKGIVYINKHKIIRVIIEAIRKDIIPKQRNKGELFKLLQSIPIMRLLIHDINALYLERSSMKYEFDITNLTTDTTLHPPCIRFLQRESENGVNLTHSQRLHLAIFYSHMGKTVDEIVDVFRNSPDFDERIARYQVEHLRGIGKGKEYKIFSCDKLRSIGLCKSDDPEVGDTICVEGVRRKGDSQPSPISTPKDFVFWKNVYTRREAKKQTV